MGVPLPKETSITDSTRDLTGTTVGRFYVRARLGKGGMGEVYLADDPQLKRPVALKRLIGEAGKDRDYRRRLLKEAQRASALNHQNIASVYDVFEEDGELFLVMEYVEGQTLRHRLREAMDVDSFVGIAVQAVEGLVAAHEKGVVHRDLKPENIMLRDDGVLKILDFGVARRLPSWREGSTLSAEEAEVPQYFAGTLPYMAPEILLEKDADTRADIFSLGVVFYETLTGRHPFRSRGYAATVERILHENPAPLSRFKPRLPEELDRIIAKMLAKNPGQRYATAADLLVDLRALEKGRAGIEEALPSHWSIWQRVETRRLAWMVLAGSLLIAAVSPWWYPAIESWGGSAPLPEQKNLVVLPIRAIGEASEDQAYCDGLTEVLTARLASLRELLVPPAVDVRAQKVESVEAARTAFAATLVLVSTWQRFGDQARVTLSLVEAKTLRQLKTKILTVDVSDPFELENRVVSWALGALEVVLPAPQESERQRTQSPEAYSVYVRARGYLQRYQDSQSINTSIALFQRALELDQSFVEASAGLGEAFLHRYELTRDGGLVKQASEACQSAIRMNDASAAGWVCLGLVNNGTGQHENAVAAFERALVLEPERENAYRGLAHAYEKLDRADDAIRTYQRALELRPDYWGVYRELGMFYYGQGRYDDAARMFERWLELEPDHVRAYSSLGGIYQLQNRMEEARELYEQSLRIEPNRSAYNNLATFYFDEGNYSGAARMYEKAIEIDPEEYFVWGNLATAYFFASGERTRARPAYERAARMAEERLTVNPNAAKVLADLAGYLVKLGRKEEAFRRMNRALELAPEDVDLMFRAGETYEELGERKLAIEWIGKALRHGFPVEVVESSPELEALQNDPRFRSVLQESN